MIHLHITRYFNLLKAKTKQSRRNHTLTLMSHLLLVLKSYIRAEKMLSDVFGYSSVHH